MYFIAFISVNVFKFRDAYIVKENATCTSKFQSKIFPLGDNYCNKVHSVQPLQVTIFLLMSAEFT